MGEHPGPVAVVDGVQWTGRGPNSIDGLGDRPVRVVDPRADGVAGDAPRLTGVEVGEVERATGPDVLNLMRLEEFLEPLDGVVDLDREGAGVDDEGVVPSGCDRGRRGRRERR
jgi:hypothetical protein